MKVLSIILSVSTMKFFVMAAIDYARESISPATIIGFSLAHLCAVTLGLLMWGLD